MLQTFFGYDRFPLGNLKKLPHLQGVLQQCNRFQLLGVMWGDEQNWSLRFGVPEMTSGKA
jgi:hypothetical protein